MKFSMIELMTSLTPRVTLRTATIPAQRAPTTIATTMISRTCSGPGSATAAPAAGGDDRGQPVLALDADVEQAHAEGDRHRQARRGTAGSPG